jgi:hypothetical protein
VAGAVQHRTHQRGSVASGNTVKNHARMHLTASEHVTLGGLSSWGGMCCC